MKTLTVLLFSLVLFCSGCATWTALEKVVDSATGIPTALSQDLKDLGQALEDAVMEDAATE